MCTWDLLNIIRCKIFVFLHLINSGDISETRNFFRNIYFAFYHTKYAVASILEFERYLSTPFLLKKIDTFEQEQIEGYRDTFDQTSKDTGEQFYGYLLSHYSQEQNKKF